MRKLAPIMALVTLWGCGDDGGAAADASVDAASVPDAELADADTTPDAYDPCPGQAYYTGEYIDWDSNLIDFKGVPLADVVERGNTGNADQTSPNGRWELCVATGTDLDFDATEVDYMDLILAMDADGHLEALSTARGLEPARRDTLFASELSLTYDVADGLVQVDLKRPNGDAVIGATVSLDVASDGGFTFNASHVMVAGTTTTDEGMVLFANVPPGNRTVTVTAPGGLTCTGRGQIPVQAATMTSVSFACN